MDGSVLKEKLSSQMLGLTFSFNLDWDFYILCIAKSASKIDVKMDGSVLKEKLSFQMLGLTFSFKLDWDFYILCIAKSASKKIELVIHSIKFVSPEVALYLYKSSTISGLVLVVSTWNCQISYKSRYVGLLVLPLLPLLNPCLIIKMLPA